MSSLDTKRLVLTITMKGTLDSLFQSTVIGLGIPGRVLSSEQRTPIALPAPGAFLIAAPGNTSSCGKKNILCAICNATFL